MTLGEADTINRQRRQLSDAAIAHATRGEWEEAVEANRQFLEFGPDTDGFNRLGKALAELGRHEEALEAYEQALERDATNRIAERNVDRLRVLLASGDGKARTKAGKTNGRPEKATAAHFIEEMGKTGHARLVNLAPARRLAGLSPGDAIELVADGQQLVARSGDLEVGLVEPRVGTRLLKLMETGNRYEAAITVLEKVEARIIIREVFAHPANFGKVSFPGSTAARAGDVRPYMKGSPLRYDDEEESEELDEDSEEVEELDTSLPEYSAEPELEEELLEET
ncbi:MAG TPA: tetratricopeptide repeat protein [Candidatus Limnocylindria bacterium]|nr:tetratricopeptide repeat protein [Candidatus Limnocylindria bacterium]